MLYIFLVKTLNIFYHSGLHWWFLLLFSALGPFLSLLWAGWGLMLGHTGGSTGHAGALHSHIWADQVVSVNVIRHQGLIVRSQTSWADSEERCGSHWPGRGPPGSHLISAQKISFIRTGYLWLTCWCSGLYYVCTDFWFLHRGFSSLWLTC